MDAANNEVAQLTAEAAKRYNANDIAGAEELARRILAVDPHHLIGLRIVGVARRKAGDFDNSVAWLKKGLDLYPENAILWFELAANYIERQQHREAYDCLTRCVQLAPNFQPAYVNLGGVLEQQERYEEALYYARRACELKPDCSMANYK